MHCKDEEYDKNCLVPTFKQSSIRVMVWACILKGKKGPLVVLKYPEGKGGGINAQQYQELVLEAEFLDFWEDMKSVNYGIAFQQGGAPSHKAKMTLKGLNDHKIGIFPHPPSSPDLNPIECVWRKLKKGIRTWSHHPSSLHELKVAVQEVWDAMDIADIDKYIDWMDDIVKAVLEANGGHT